MSLSPEISDENTPNPRSIPLRAAGHFIPAAGHVHRRQPPHSGQSRPATSAPPPPSANPAPPSGARRPPRALLHRGPREPTVGPLRAASGPAGPRVAARAPSRPTAAAPPRASLIQHRRPVLRPPSAAAPPPGEVCRRPEAPPPNRASPSAAEPHHVVRLAAASPARRIRPDPGRRRSPVAGSAGDFLAARGSSASASAPDPIRVDPASRSAA
nr:extensin-like [Aegilops tauschii subsp. strangulata]